MTNRAHWRKLPVLRKAELMRIPGRRPALRRLRQSGELCTARRVFQSPGPIWEPQGPGSDPWQAARAFFAAGIRAGDIVHNAFSYHHDAGRLHLDEGARALGCTVFPAGTGNTDMQVEAAAIAEARRLLRHAGFPEGHARPRRRDGKGPVVVPARRWCRPARCFRRCAHEYLSRGVSVLQCYATAEFGVIAYESAARDGTPNPGMIVNENLIVEIVRRAPAIRCRTARSAKWW